MLPDRWEGMSGTYLGKSWEGVDFLISLYEVQDPKQVVYFMKIYERLIVSSKAEEAERRRKAEERKAQAASGKDFTHNVKG